MFYFLSDTKSYDVVETEKQAYEGGKAFGKFQAMLSDIPAGEMFEVIPDFHNIQKRLQQLDEAVANDAAGRVASVKNELDTVAKYAASMQYFQQPAQVAALPKRVIHNDTKFNNVLLDKNDEAQCVIDLETVMDGYVAYDFGDAIRTIINTTTEDEADLSKIQLNIPLV
jgi:Ser/Thr protein kinase RdoA (MazF antagonist)